MFKTIYRIIKLKLRDRDFNVIGSVLLNIKAVSFYEMISVFPILIFGKIEMDIKGKIHIDKPLNFGMIQLGRRAILEQGRRNSVGQLQISKGSVLRIMRNAGNVVVCPGFSIFVKRNACIELTPPIYIGYDCRIISAKNIIIGENFSSGWNLLLMDNDGHYIKDLINGVVKNNKGDIKIGNNVWLANNVTILKSSIIPNGSIIASHSLINRAMTSTNSIYAGSPARCIKENVCRVWNNEDELDAFFAENESCVQIND